MVVLIMTLNLNFGKNINRRGKQSPSMKRQKERLKLPNYYVITVIG